MADRASTVIVGAGIAGASIAYHLARRGRRDVILLDQSAPISGTTSHAPGLVGQLRSSPGLTRMLQYSVALYRTLRLQGEGGFLGEGSLRLASSRARMEQLRQQADFARSVGLQARLVGADEAFRLCPLLRHDDLEGALHLPTDGSAVARLLAGALLEGARTLGVRCLPQTAVRRVEVESRVRAVETAAGRIETQTLVIAAGIWSPLVGRLAGVNVALTPMQHQYAVTAPVPGLAGHTIPNVRDPDRLIYFRQDGDRVILGGYERNPRLWNAEEIPSAADPTVLPFDAQHFEPLRRSAVERVPALHGLALERCVNGLESFTPDGEFLLGPTEVEGVWAACGFCAHGVSGAGGVGRVVSDWLLDGDPGVDVSAMDPRRFGAMDRGEIQRRACEVYGTYYDIK